MCSNDTVCDKDYTLKREKMFKYITVEQIFDDIIKNEVAE